MSWPYKGDRALCRITAYRGFTDQHRPRISDRLPGSETSEAPSSSTKGARRLLTTDCLVPPGDAGALAAEVRALLGASYQNVRPQPGGGPAVS